MIWYRAQELKRVGRWQDQVGYCVDKVVLRLAQLLFLRRQRLNHVILAGWLSRNFEPHDCAFKNRVTSQSSSFIINCPFPFFLFPKRIVFISPMTHSLIMINGPIL